MRHGIWWFIINRLLGAHNSSWNISPELLLGLGPPIIDLRGETDISSRYRVDGRQGFESVTAKTSKQKGGTNKTIKVAHKKISTWPSGGRKKQRHMVLGSIYVMSSLNFQGGWLHRVMEGGIWSIRLNMLPPELIKKFQNLRISGISLA